MDIYLASLPMLAVWVLKIPQHEVGFCCVHSTGVRAYARMHIKLDAVYMR